MPKKNQMPKTIYVVKVNPGTDDEFLEGKDDPVKLIADNDPGATRASVYVYSHDININNEINVTEVPGTRTKKK